MDLDTDLTVEDDVVATTEVDDSLHSNHLASSQYILSSGRASSHSKTRNFVTSLDDGKKPLQTGLFSRTLTMLPAIHAVATVFPPAQGIKGAHHIPQDSNVNSVSVNIPPPCFANLPYSTSRTGVVYDPRMRFHQDPAPEDPEDPHPEGPDRIYRIFHELVDAGLAADIDLPEISTKYHLFRLPARAATEEEINLVHSRKHIQFIKDLAGLPTVELKAFEKIFDNSVYFHNLTYLCASISAGGAIQAARAVVQSLVKNAVAIVRPPGHHAEPFDENLPSRHEHGGFCMFNNVSIATKVVQQEFKDQCRKVMILDWDVHHGNGIQNCFYEDANVLYVSIHRYEDGRFYPHGPNGANDRCGKGPGQGRNINIGWPRSRMGDAEYIYAFQQIVMPVGIEFDPDLVIISAGFDAADGDQLGGCHVTPAGYGHMTHMLMQLAKGKVMACLEGGYNLTAISKSFCAMTRVLMGEPPDRMSGIKALQAEAIETVHEVIRYQSKFWSSLWPKTVASADRRQKLGSRRLHDIIREWQALSSYQEHLISPLFIRRQGYSETFKNEVLATGNYHEERPLMVIFHDPPEAAGLVDPVTNELELHNTWLTDVSKAYMSWAIEQGFSLIDVNIPKHVTNQEDVRDYVVADQAAMRKAATKELAHYLWKNYIETGESTHVFMLGIGEAYYGIVDLFNTYRKIREKTTAPSLEQTTFAIGFIAENSLSKFTRTDDDAAANRYYNNTIIFVNEEHPIFLEKKRRRHGRLYKSTCVSLQDMMAQHMSQVTELLAEKTRAWRQARKATGMDANPIECKSVPKMQQNNDITMVS